MGQYSRDSFSSHGGDTCISAKKNLISVGKRACEMFPVEILKY